MKVLGYGENKLYRVEYVELAESKFTHRVLVRKFTLVADLPPVIQSVRLFKAEPLAWATFHKLCQQMGLEAVDLEE
jgi:hypothetical protein